MIASVALFFAVYPTTTALSILSANNLKATWVILPESVNTSVSYPTTADMSAWTAAGGEIGAYANTGLDFINMVDLYNTSGLPACQSRLLTIKNKFEVLGFPVVTAIPQQRAWNTALASLGPGLFTTIASVGNQGPFQTLPVPNPYFIDDGGPLPSATSLLTSLDYRNALDSLIDTGGLWMPGFHKIGPTADDPLGTFDTTEFTNFCQYLAQRQAQGLVRVVTFNQIPFLNAEGGSDTNPPDAGETIVGKITLNALSNLQNETTTTNAINANSTEIVAAFDNTLSRDGTTPNEMLSTLDMNSEHIINLPTPLDASSPLRLQDLNAFVGGGTITNIPIGGTTNQALKKTSNANFDVSWQSIVKADVGLSNADNTSDANKPISTAQATANATFVVGPASALSGRIPQWNGTSGKLLSDSTYTLPASTIVGTTDAQTLTNKTLTSPTLTTPALGVATATSINGATLDNTAWSTYTPVVTAGAGTPTTTVTSGRYKQIGKTVHVQVIITITNKGTASGLVITTLPFTSGIGYYTGSIFEYQTTGKCGAFAVLPSVNTAIGNDSTGTTFWVDGYKLISTITYEIA